MLKIFKSAKAPGKMLGPGEVCPMAHQGTPPGTQQQSEKSEIFKI